MENKENIKTTKIQGVNFNYNAETHYEKDGHIYCRKCNTQIDGKLFEVKGYKKWCVETLANVRKKKKESKKKD